MYVEVVTTRLPNLESIINGNPDEYSHKLCCNIYIVLLLLLNCIYLIKMFN